MKRLWYRQPAAAWEETLPLGNGSLGAMVWGGVETERIGLNHERLWSGYYENHDPKEAKNWLPQIRALILKEQYEQAERLMERYCLGEYTESYMPAGDLWIELPKVTAVNSYHRELRLEEAKAYVSAVAGGNRVQREYFVSHPAKALMIRLQSQRPVTEIRIRYQSQMKRNAITTESKGIRYDMQCPEHVDPAYLGERPHSVIWGARGLLFSVSIRILYTDGRWEAEADQIRVKGATQLELAVSILERPAEMKRFAEYEREHIQDFRHLYDRMELEMPGKEELPTDEWLKDPDPGLFALYFQYGRYLMISSSREGGLPANLQGIWSWELRAPWSSNWTTNINMEMNYWPALPVNLKECDFPYTDMIQRLTKEGRKTAASLGCRGACCGHNTDGWETTNPVGVARGEQQGEEGCLMWAFWVMALPWMDQEVWRMDWYHPDLEYVRQVVYPVLRESVLFCLDWLIERDGYWITCPSTSPENQFWHQGKKISVSAATTMDMTLIRELFRNFRSASMRLGKTELLKQMDRVEERLYPAPIDPEGAICEWFEPKDETEPGHRHLSHLYGLFPSDLWRKDEALRRACETALSRRMEAGSGHTGWSLAWIVNLYVVLENQEKAEQYLEQMLRRSTYPNLWSRHPPYQIDGNFGITAAIAHMLAAEEEGEARLLPCLPPSWKTGIVRGLCLPGGRQVSFEWKEGRVTQYEIVSESD